MKASRYNIEIEDKNSGCVYWYNALYKSHFRVSRGLNEKLRKFIVNPEDAKTCIGELYDKFIAGGFYVDDDVDELEIVRSKAYVARNSKDYFLVILPTLNCNYRCWYCIQDHVVSVMSDVTMNRIKLHLKSKIFDEGITSLHISWFGGEPFMFYNQVVRPLSLYAIELCEQAGIPFMNSATSNGYFINEAVSKDLSALKFSHFQITLDGDKVFHDKVKYIKNCESTFSYVLDNINRFMTENPIIKLFLRINYTHTTLTKKIVDDVCNHIEMQNRSHVVITPRKVWQESVDNEFAPVLTEVLDAFEANGFKVERWNANHTFTSCYVNKRYHNAINYNGRVVKCTACDDLYKSDVGGILAENGQIIWSDDYEERCCQATFESSMCLRCKYLPVCMGPCPRNFIEGRKQCNYTYSDTNIEDCMRYYLRQQYK